MPEEAAGALSGKAVCEILHEAVSEWWQDPCMNGVDRQAAEAEAEVAAARHGGGGIAVPLIEGGGGGGGGGGAALTLTAGRMSASSDRSSIGEAANVLAGGMPSIGVNLPTLHGGMPTPPFEGLQGGTTGDRQQAMHYLSVALPAYDGLPSMMDEGE